MGGDDGSGTMRGKGNGKGSVEGKGSSTVTWRRRPVAPAAAAA